jgi:hypothetical protein
VQQLPVLLAVLGQCVGLGLHHVLLLLLLQLQLLLVVPLVGE